MTMRDAQLNTAARPFAHRLVRRPVDACICDGDSTGEHDDECPRYVAWYADEGHRDNTDDRRDWIREREDW